MTSNAKPTDPPAASPEDEATRVLERSTLQASAASTDAAPSAAAPGGATKVTGPLVPSAQVTQAFAVPDVSEDAGLTAPEMPAIGAPGRAMPPAPMESLTDDPGAGSAISSQWWSCSPSLLWSQQPHRGQASLQRQPH